MDRVFSLRADGSAVSLMQEDKRTEEQSPPCAEIKRDRGKVISAVLMSHTIYSLPESTGKTVPAQSQKRTALCAVWIKKMKILSCACMTRQNVWIRTLLYENVK